MWNIAITVTWILFGTFSGLSTAGIFPVEHCPQDPVLGKSEYVDFNISESSLLGHHVSASIGGHEYGPHVMNREDEKWSFDKGNIACSISKGIFTIFFKAFKPQYAGFIQAYSTSKDSRRSNDTGCLLNLKGTAANTHHTSLVLILAACCVATLLKVS